MTEFLVHDINWIIVRFSSSIILTITCLLSIVAIYIISKGNELSNVKNKMVALAGLLFIFSTISYLHFQELIDYYIVSNRKVEQYYTIEKVGNNLLFTEKESHIALKDTLLSEIISETNTEYILILDNKKVIIPKTDVIQ